MLAWASLPRNQRGPCIYVTLDIACSRFGNCFYGARVVHPCGDTSLLRFSIQCSRSRLARSSVSKHKNANSNTNWVSLFVYRTNIFFVKIALNIVAVFTCVALFYINISLPPIAWLDVHIVAAPVKPLTYRLTECIATVFINAAWTNERCLSIISPKRPPF